MSRLIEGFCSSCWQGSASLTTEGNVRGTQENVTPTSLQRGNVNEKVVPAHSTQRFVHLETYSLRLLRLNLTSYDFTTFLPSCEEQGHHFGELLLIHLYACLEQLSSFICERPIFVTHLHYKSLFNEFFTGSGSGVGLKLAPTQTSCVVDFATVFSPFLISWENFMVESLASSTFTNILSLSW